MSNCVVDVMVKSAVRLSGKAFCHVWYLIRMSRPMYRSDQMVGGWGGIHSSLLRTNSKDISTYEIH